MIGQLLALHRTNVKPCSAQSFLQVIWFSVNTFGCTSMSWVRLQKPIQDQESEKNDTLYWAEITLALLLNLKNLLIEMAWLPGCPPQPSRQYAWNFVASGVHIQGGLMRSEIVHMQDIWILYLLGRVVAKQIRTQGSPFLSTKWLLCYTMVMCFTFYYFLSATGLPTV